MDRQLREAVRNGLIGLGIQDDVKQLCDDLTAAGLALSKDQAVAVARQFSEQVAVRQAFEALPLLPALLPEPTVPQQLPATHPDERGGPSPWCLRVRVTGAAAFSDYLLAPQPASQAAARPGGGDEHMQPPGRRLLSLHLQLFGQSLETPSVAGCAEPPLVGDFLFDLPPPATKRTQQKQAPGSAAVPGGDDGVVSLLTLRQPLVLVAVESEAPIGAADAEGAEASDMPAYCRTPVATAVVDWRQAFVGQAAAASSTAAAEAARVCVELRPIASAAAVGRGGDSGGGGNGTMPDGPVATGVVWLELQAVSRASCSSSGLAGGGSTEALLRRQRLAEASRDAEALKRYLAEAARWWQEQETTRRQQHWDAAASPLTHCSYVPLLATTHDGCLCPLPHLVHPLPAGGVLETPQHAARYVSLLQSRRSASPAATAAPPGHPSGLVFNGCCLPHVVLAAGSATPAERPLLLCSLLLGFGMDAWVCVGTAAAVGGAQQSVLGGLWVVTRRHGACSASLWDPCTGRRYDTPEGCCLHESAAVTCLFNHNAIYSSTTPGGAVLTGLLRDGGLDLNNHAAWHGLHVTPAMLPPPQPTCTPPPPSAAAGHMQLERQVEWVVKELLSQRLTGAANGPRAVAWDDSLAQKLALVLVGHEEEALTGAAALCLEDFNHVIQRCVPKGYVFRGLPLHFNHLCPTRLARRLLEDTQAYGILAGHRAVSAVALKLRVKEYGKHVRSVWIMLGSIALG